LDFGFVNDLFSVTTIAFCSVLLELPLFALVWEAGLLLLLEFLDKDEDGRGNFEFCLEGLLGLFFYLLNLLLEMSLLFSILL